MKLIYSLLVLFIISGCTGDYDINQKYYLGYTDDPSNQTICYRIEGSLVQCILPNYIGKVWHNDGWIVAQREYDMSKIEYWILKVDLHLKFPKDDQIKFGPFSKKELHAGLKKRGLSFASMYSN